MITTIRFIKKEGKMQPNSKTDEFLYNKFKKQVDDNVIIEAFFEVLSDTGTLGQLKKLHKVIREVCYHTGHNFDDLKLVIKKRSGLCIIKDIDGDMFLECRSFGDCSYEELSIAIQAAMELGGKAGMPIL